MKKLICAILAIAMLSGVALADVETTGNVNLRQGPGKEYEVIASVEKGNILTDLDCVSTDDRGVDWYWVEYNGEKCWVSSKYARIIASELEANTGYIALEEFYGTNIEWAAQELDLPGYEYTGGELENSYFNDDFIILGNATVECIVITGDMYSLFGATMGMMWYDALNACIENGLYVIRAGEIAIVLEREAQYPYDMKSCVNLFLNADGTINEIDWSTYTSD